MKNLVLASLALLLCQLALAAALADAAIPEQYQQNCIDCHSRITGGDGSVLYDRKGGIVRTPAELERRIAFYEEELGLKWSPSQARQVADYLNRNFYRFQKNQ